MSAPLWCDIIYPHPVLAMTCTMWCGSYLVCTVMATRVACSTVADINHGQNMMISKKTFLVSQQHRGWRHQTVCVWSSSTTSRGLDFEGIRGCYIRSRLCRRWWVINILLALPSNVSVKIVAASRRTFSSMVSHWLISALPANQKPCEVCFGLASSDFNGKSW